MAQKINQITIGDMLYIQLDDNPRDTGYQAPMGSSAVYIDTVKNIGRFFHKEGAGATNWREIMPWNVFGNQEANHRLFGTLTNFDITFIRNNVEYIKALQNTDPNQKDVEISLFNRDMSIVDFDVPDGYETFGKIVVFNQVYTGETPLESDRYSFAIQSLGSFRTSCDLGVIHESRNIDPLSLDEIYTKEAKRGKGLRNAIPALGVISLSCFNLNSLNPEMLTVNIKAIIKRDSDGLIVDLERRFNINSSLFASQQFSKADRQDIASYFQFGSLIVDLDLRFQNTSDLYVPEVGNTLDMVIDFIGLDDLETYTIMEWTTITILER